MGWGTELSPYGNRERGRGGASQACAQGGLSGAGAAQSLGEGSTCLGLACGAHGPQEACLQLVREMAGTGLLLISCLCSLCPQASLCPSTWTLRCGPSCPPPRGPHTSPLCTAHCPPAASLRSCTGRWPPSTAGAGEHRDSHGAHNECGLGVRGRPRQGCGGFSGVYGGIGVGMWGLTGTYLQLIWGCRYVPWCAAVYRYVGV